MLKDMFGTPQAYEQELRMAKSELWDFSSRLTKCFLALLEEREEWVDEKSSLEENMDALSNDLDDTRRDLERSEEKVSDLEVDMSRLEEDLDEVRTNLYNREVELEDAQQRIADLEEELKNANV